MPVLSSPHFRDHEQVLFCHDPGAGLRGLIAIHDTTLGPALGGLRVWPYENEQAAIDDVLRLSRGMTYKAAMARLPYGGGKAVIWLDKDQPRDAALFQAFGRHVAALGGRYITAEDVGTAPRDLSEVFKSTRYVVGIPEVGGGDPSPATAWGVFHGIRAAVAHKFAGADLRGLRVAIQGLGHVGWYLAQHLHEAGARLAVADIDDQRLNRAVEAFDAQAVAPDAIHGADADVFAPCALGAVIDDATIPQLKATIVAGSANNQLAEDRHGEALRRAGVLYAPDYVINAGGIIKISHEGPHYEKTAAFAHCAAIAETLDELFARAEADGVATNSMADRLAEERIAAARRPGTGDRPALRAVV